MSLKLSCRRTSLALAIMSLAACSPADEGKDAGGGGFGGSGAGASATAGAGQGPVGGAAVLGMAGSAATQAGAATGGAVAGGATSMAGSAQAGATSGGMGGGAQAGTAAVAGSAGTGSGGGSGVGGKLVGFATLNGGTTGGAAGQTVTATTFAQLKMYAESAAAYVINVSGTISNGADGGKISIKSNKSLIGVGNNALLNGVGLEVANSNNVIIQNLRITLMGVTTRTDVAGVYSTSDGAILVNGGDAISISGTSKNVWVDHCELYSEDPAVQTNKDLYDGLIDIRGSQGDLAPQLLQQGEAARADVPRLDGALLQQLRGRRDGRERDSGRYLRARREELLRSAALLDLHAG